MAGKAHIWREIDSLIREKRDSDAVKAVIRADRVSRKNIFKRSFLAHRLLQLDSALLSGICRERALPDVLEDAGLVQACHFMWQARLSQAGAAQCLKYNLRGVFKKLDKAVVPHPYTWGDISKSSRLDRRCFELAGRADFVEMLFADESGRPEGLCPESFGDSLFQGRLMSPDVFLAFDGVRRQRMLSQFRYFRGSSVFLVKFLLALLDDPRVPAGDKAIAVREYCASMWPASYVPTDAKAAAERRWLSRAPDVVKSAAKASSYGEFELTLSAGGECIESSDSPNKLLLFMLMFRPGWAAQWRASDPEGAAGVCDFGETADILAESDGWKDPA